MLQAFRTQFACHPCQLLLMARGMGMGAVRDTRRAEHPGGTKKLVAYNYDTTAKDEALEVGGQVGWM